MGHSWPNYPGLYRVTMSPRRGVPGYSASDATVMAQERTGRLARGATELAQTLIACGCKYSQGRLL